MGGVRVAIALGSNVGDRAAHLAYAVARLADVLTNLRVSTFHETEPVGVAPQPSFLNAAVVGETTWPAPVLLDTLLAIEAERGRERPHAGAPRTLDLDLILYGEELMHEASLTVPHPRFRERAFVLEPLSEIAPDWVDPLSGKTIRELRHLLQP